MTINGDTGANYPLVYAGGDGANPFSTTQTGNTYYNMNQTENGSVGIYQFFDANATDKHKTILHRMMRPSAYTLMQAGRWANTSRITTLLITAAGGTWNSGTTMSLYGIAGQTMTMQVIQHIELGSAQANIDFTNIPNTFTDLLLVSSMRSSSSNPEDGWIQFNGDTAANYLS